MIDQRIPKHGIRRFTAQADPFSIHFDQGGSHLFAYIFAHLHHRHALHHHAPAVGPARLSVGHHIEGVGFEIGGGIGARPATTAEVAHLSYALRRTRRRTYGHRHPLAGPQPRNTHRSYPLHLHPVVAASHIVSQQQTARLDASAHQQALDFGNHLPIGLQRQAVRRQLIGIALQHPVFIHRIPALRIGRQIGQSLRTIYSQIPTSNSIVSGLSKTGRPQASRQKQSATPAQGDFGVRIGNH